MKAINDTTRVILAKWRDGVAAEIIAAEYGRSVNSILKLASYHKVRRPAWYLSAVRTQASGLPLKRASQ